LPESTVPAAKSVKNQTNPSSKADNPLFDDVEPHHDPVNPAELLDEIKSTLEQYIVLTPYQVVAVTLWIALSWFVAVMQVLPLLLIDAPDKECGKTQLLDVVGRMTARGFTVANITLAALFRVIDQYLPTLLIDEADTFFRDKSEITGLINAGHTKSSAWVLRLVGDYFDPKKFSVWCAKAIAGISLKKHLPDSTMSRGIVIKMRRKMVNEKVKRLRHAEPGLFDEIKSKMARFAADYAEQISQARPHLPDELSDRAQDNWEPLLAIAECAGPEWVERATDAALKLSGERESSASIGNELLADIQYIFESKGDDKISTVDLIAALSEDQEMPWATYNRGKPLTPRQLAKHLGGYGIKSKTVRFKYDTPKGYDLGQFEDVFARYLASPENLPQRRNVSPQPMPAMDSGIADKTQPIRNGTPTSETQQNGNRNETATPEPLPVLECGVVADVAANLGDDADY
jgi:putative DNA primase/helicase